MNSLKRQFFPLALGSLVVFVVAGVFAIGLLMKGERRTQSALREVFQGSGQDDLDILGRTAPDFSLDLLAGESFRLQDHIGRKVVVVNFFATWCGPCRAELPVLKQLVADYSAKDFMFVAVSSSDSPLKLREFVRQHRLGFSVGADAKRSISDAYGVSAIPHTFVVGADGRVAFAARGSIESRDKTLRAEIDKGLAMLADGAGISKEDYLKNLVYDTVAENDPAYEDIELSERAAGIAEQIDCPCRCSDPLTECHCETAERIKEFLSDEKNIDGKTDAQVIEEIKRRFGKN